MNPRETLAALSVSKERELGTVGGLQGCTKHRRAVALLSACYDQQALGQGIPAVWK